MSTLQSGPGPAGEPWAASPRTSGLARHCLQLCGRSHDAHSWLRIAPVFFLSLFFFFHPLLSMSALQNPCGRKEGEKKGGGEWEKREVSQPKLQHLLLSPGKWGAGTMSPPDPGGLARMAAVLPAACCAESYPGAINPAPSPSGRRPSYPPFVLFFICNQGPAR